MEYRIVVRFGVLCAVNVIFASATYKLERDRRTIPDTANNAICYCAHILCNESWATCEKNVTDGCFPLQTYKAFIVQHDPQRVNDTDSEHGDTYTQLTTEPSPEKDDGYLKHEECLNHTLSSNKDGTVYSKKTVITIACISCFGGILVGCVLAVVYTKISKYQSKRRKYKLSKTNVNAKEMDKKIEKEQLILNDGTPKDLNKLMSESEQLQKVGQNVEKDDDEELDGEDLHRYDDLIPFGSERLRGSLHLYRGLEQPGKHLYMSMKSKNEERNNHEGDQASITDTDVASDEPNMVGTGLKEGDIVVHTDNDNQSMEELTYANTDEILDDSIQDTDLYENVGKHPTEDTELYENL